MKALLAGLAILVLYTARSQETGPASLTIYFDFDKYVLTGKATKQLDSFFAMQPGYWSTHRLEINGHCDQAGTDSYNNSLSAKRVHTVKSYIVQHHIAASLIGVKAHGEKMPVNEGKTASDRQWSRRVEIHIVDKTAAGNRDGEMSIQEKIADSATIAGSIIVLKNINFHGARHKILPSSYTVLEELLNVMKNNPKLVIQVEGHICCEPGNADGVDNETGLSNLSEARARAIQDYLTVNGIDPSRVGSKGFGHSVPLYPYPEQSEEERIANRRVEIKIIRK